MTPVERRRIYKDHIVNVMGGSCVCCGYNKCNRALHLHHINSEDKNFTISNKNYYAWEKLENELKKCVLVCSNCHMEIEDGIKSSPNISSFNKEIFDMYLDEIQNKKIGKVCIDCGKPIDYKATRCVSCSNKHRQITDRPTRNELKILIRTTPFTKIGLKYGVSDNAIRKWCENYNLPKKSSEIKKYSDEEWELI